MPATREIHHVVRFSAKPAVIYRMLMDSKRHAAFTGAPASIDAKVGGKFRAWGPHLRGVTVELVKNKRIVQAWRAANWPTGHYSLAIFELASRRGGTTLVFTQTGVPAKNARSINSGWKSHYWEPIKKVLRDN